MNEETNNKGPLTIILGLLALGLIAGIAWLLLGRSGDSTAISSDLMVDGDTSGESAEGLVTGGEGAELATNGVRFMVTQNTFAAAGAVNAQTKFSLDPVIALTYGDGASNALSGSSDVPAQPYDPAIVGLVSMMATNIENGDLEVTDTTVTASGTVPTQAFKDQFDALLSAESGFTQEIVNNITVEQKGFSEVELVNENGSTTVTGSVKNAEIQTLIQNSSTELFGADTTVNVSVDESLFAGYSWSRFPEFVGGLSNFENWTAGSVNNNPFAILTDGLNFDTASAQLSPADQERLVGLLPIIFASSGQTTVTGHTDSDGTDAANLELSQRRANSVVQSLVVSAVVATGSDNALSEDDFIVEGRGESEPVADNNTAEGRALNRRVEFGIQR